ncbi:hypothetical protein CVT24_006357, partial [Panaeolus cyanescens]
MSVTDTVAAPLYDAPGADKAILNFAETALRVQERFADARYDMDKICKDLSIEEVSTKLYAIDEMFNDVFAESRKTSTRLKGHVRHFVNDVVPLVSRSDIAIEERQRVVDIVAENISQAAVQNTTVFDDGFALVKKDLDDVLATLKVEQKAVSDHSKTALYQANADIQKLADYVKQNETLCGRLSGAYKNVFNSITGRHVPVSAPPVTVPVAEGKLRYSRPIQAIVDSIQNVSDFITGGAVLKANADKLEEKLDELVRLQHEIEKQTKVVDEAVKDVDRLSELFKTLYESSDAFQGVWKK